MTSEPPRNTHGGRRPGAGRPCKPGSESHRRRPAFAGPVLVTLRFAAHVPDLRGRRCREVIDAALLALTERPEVRVTHSAVLGGHLHLIVESSERSALSSAMRSLDIRIARGLNRVMGESGRVFAARYHARVLRTPTEIENAVRYVVTSAGT